MKKALVVIDFQKGFLTKHTSSLPKKMRKFIEQHRADYNLILFTQYRNRPGSNFVRNLKWRRFMSEKEYGIFDELRDLTSKDNLFPKYTYSSFVTEEVSSVLKQNGISEVHLAGIDTENCVLTFARDAFDRGYKVVVLKDLCRSHSNPTLHKAALEIIKNNIGEVR